MTQVVNVGIVGCGRVLSGPYRPLMQTLLNQRQIRVTAACDVRETRGAFVRETFGAEFFTTDFQTLVTSADVDLVMVLTPPAEHARVVQAALEAGKHVLVEKPLALNLQDAQNIAVQARNSAGYLACAPFVTLSPTFQAIQRHIANGDIGKILSARTLYGWAGPNWGKWFYKRGGGGPLFDLAVYNLTTLTGLVGPVKRVMAMGGITIPERVVDGEAMSVEVQDHYQILLDFGDGVLGVLTTGFTMQRLRCPAIELYGSEGTLQMLGADWKPNGYELWQNKVGAWQVFEETATDWNYADGLGHIVACIQQDVRPSISPEHALHVLEIMLTIERAAEDAQAHTLHTNLSFASPAQAQ